MSSVCSSLSRAPATGDAICDAVLRGDDPTSLRAGTEQLSLALASYPGVGNVADDWPYGRDEVIFLLTPAGRALGLSAETVGRQLRSAYSGARVQVFHEDDAELEVNVMLPNHERRDLSLLGQFPIRTPNGDFVPLASVADLVTTRGIDTIRHTDGQMSVRVSADVDEELNTAFAVVDDVQNNVSIRLAG